MIINNRPIISPQRPVGTSTNVQKTKSGQVTGNSFDDLLKQKIQQQTDVKFSKHAEARLSSRNIDMKPEQIERISNGINKAQEKGVKDSLVLVDDVALVVNVKNRTIVTAANANELKENVFTNIDGAVIV